MTCPYNLTMNDVSTKPSLTLDLDDEVDAEEPTNFESTSDPPHNSQDEHETPVDAEQLLPPSRRGKRRDSRVRFEPEEKMIRCAELPSPWDNGRRQKLRRRLFQFRETLVFPRSTGNEQNRGGDRLSRVVQSAQSPPSQQSHPTRSGREMGHVRTGSGLRHVWKRDLIFDSIRRVWRTSRNVATCSIFEVSGATRSSREIFDCVLFFSPQAFDWTIEVARLWSRYSNGFNFSQSILTIVDWRMT